MILSEVVAAVSAIEGLTVYEGAIPAEPTLPAVGITAHERGTLVTVVGASRAAARTADRAVFLALWPCEFRRVSSIGATLEFIAS
jgi:hypothetical protein